MHNVCSIAATFIFKVIMNTLFTGQLSMVILGVASLIASNRNELKQAPRAASKNSSVTDEKASRTEGQKKLDSRLVMALNKSRKELPFNKPTTLDPDVRIEVDGHSLGDLNAKVSPALLQQISGPGGQVLSSYESARAIHVKLPLTALAAHVDIQCGHHFISPTA